jgi:hypothetical protein
MTIGFVIWCAVISISFTLGYLYRKFGEERNMTAEPRGGQGRNFDGSWAVTDGKGCPLCGAIRLGGHGGGCPNTEQYDEQGNVIR